MGASKWRFCSWVYYLVWFVAPKKRKLSQVSQRYQGWSDLGAGLGGVCMCVPFVVLLCGSMSWAISLHLHTAPFIGSIPARFGLCVIFTVYPLPLVSFSCSCNIEKGSVKQLLDFLHLTSELKLCQKSLNSFFHSDFIFTLLSILITSLICTSNGKLMTDDAGWNKKTKDYKFEGEFCC